MYRQRSRTATPIPTPLARSFSCEGCCTTTPEVMQRPPRTRPAPTPCSGPEKLLEWDRGFYGEPGDCTAYSGPCSKYQLLQLRRLRFDDETLPGLMSSEKCGHRTPPRSPWTPFIKEVSFEKKKSGRKMKTKIYNKYILKFFKLIQRRRCHQSKLLVFFT